MNEEQEFKQAALTAGMLNLKAEFDNRFQKVVEDWQNAVAALLLNVDETWRAKNEVSWFEAIHDNIAGHEMVKPRDWSQATLDDVPVDWMPEDAVIYWGVDLELKKVTKPLVFGYDADVNLNTHRLFPTAALAQQYLDSQKPAERWMPEGGQKYWYVTIDCGVTYIIWKGDSIDSKLFGCHNVFPSEQEALAARDRVKKALKGE